tara:strand:- start:1106 stop:2044 length:939 start_codon:yes stop_codon:yes gene_type:complete
MNQDDIINPLTSTRLFGLTNYLVDLINLHDQKKLPKVIMLSGKKGLGKFTLINHLMNYIFSKDDYDIKSQTINSKSIKYSQIVNGSFENVSFIENEGINKIKIDDIRVLKSKLFKSSLSLGPRFFIFNDIDLLSSNSANALLKIIEEPSDKDFFILIDNKQKSVIDTISSRCLITKIFLKKSENIKIIESLINLYNLDKHIEYEKSDLTPGNFLVYNAFCNENQITYELDHITKIDKLLKLYKKTKNIVYINMSIFFTDQYFYKLSLENSSKILLLNELKIVSIKNINDFVAFNLNLNSVLNSINKYYNYAK